MIQEKTPTNLEFALLGLIHQAPQSGYDLRKIFEETALGSYSSSPGAIYPAIKRLETKGLIEGEIDSTKSLRPKKVYAPTEAGRKLFRKWLVQEITVDDVKRRQDELLLRFAFYSILDDPHTSLSFLKSLSEGADANLKDLLEQRTIFAKNNEIPHVAAFYGRMSLDFGIEQTRALRRWARKSMKKFDDQIEAPS